MATRRKRIIAAILVAAAVVVGVTILLHRRNGREQAMPQTVVVRWGTVIASVSGNGVLKPVTTVEVKSNVGGQVVQLAVDEGDFVRAGQLIARIDPSDLLASLEQSQAEYESTLAKVRQARQQANVQPKLTSTAIEQAESALASARAALRQTRTALIPQKLASVQSSYDQAKATYNQAEKHLKRQKALLEQGFVPKSQVDIAEEQYAVAKAQLESAQSRWETVKQEADQDLKAAEARSQEAKAALESAKANAYQIGIKREDITQAQAQAERAKASVNNARTQLGYTTIYAPRSGVVVKKYVEAGSIVTAGRASFAGTGAGVTIVEIADVNRMLVEVSVDETDVAQIRVGQVVHIAVDAYPDERFAGKVAKIAPKAVVDQNVTTIPVTVEIARPDQRLKPGMNATCDFIIERRENVLLVPNEAVKETADGTMVTVMEQKMQVPRRVKVGISDDRNTEIISGLREGETVVSKVIEPAGETSSPGGSQRRMRGGPPGPF